jgi:hypothetical protein
MSEQEMMDAWTKTAATTKEHELLGKHVGQWDVVIRHWMNPAEPPSESTGTATLRMILGGRVLVEEFKSDMMGMPFEGHGMMGFDTFRGRWWQTWNDNMGTGIYKGDGPAGSDAKVVTMTGKTDRAAMNQKDVEMKGVYRFISDNEHVFETYDKGPDGKDIRTMEIRYTRHK